MSILFIVNPHAGKGEPQKAVPIIRRVMDEAGVPCAFIETRKAAHATDITRDAVRQTDVSGIVAVGGDGTVQEVAEGLLGSDVPMGIVPLGNGNDFARSYLAARKLAPPKKWEEAAAWYARRIAECRPARIDAIRIGAFTSLNIGSIGLDSDIAREAHYMKKTFGKFSYIISTLKNAATFRPFKARLICDGKALDGAYTLIAFCNGQYYGGGFRIAPGAKLDDGKLTICAVTAMPRAKVLALFPSAIMGRHGGIKQVSFAECRVAEVFFEGTMRANFDGNIFELKSPLRFEVVPGAVRMF